MKLKILAVPVLIVLIIIFSIWVIKPTYTVSMEKKIIYLQAVEKVDDIRGKLENAKKLNEQMSSLGEERRIISEYLPEKKEDEYIINYINDLALKDGMTIINVTLHQRNSPPLAPILDDPGNPTSEFDTTPTAKYMDMDFSVAGNYDKVRSFLKKLERLKRFNNISRVTISKGNGGNEEVGTSSDVLLATAVTGFGYLEKIKTVTKISDQIIASDQFDLTIVDMIKSSKNTESSALIPDTAGKSNPFLP